MWVKSEPGHGATFGFHLPRNIDRHNSEAEER